MNESDSAPESAARAAERHAKLFRRARSDEEAFAALYRLYSPAVYTWFRRHVASEPEVAADLTAEVFARVVLELQRFRGARDASGPAWLFAIAHHLGADYARRRRVELRARSKLRLDVPYVPGLDEDVEERLADGESAAVLEALEQLTAAQQQAIRLRVLDELPFAEVAEQTGTTPLASRLLVLRGLRNLRRLVSESGKERS